MMSEESQGPRKLWLLQMITWKRVASVLLTCLVPNQSLSLSDKAHMEDLV